MNYRTFNFTDTRVNITLTKSRYTRTASGKSWKSKPDEHTTETITTQFYSNCVTAVPFFGDRVQFNYTPAGYIPVRITSTSPDNSTKIIYEFKFTYNERATK
jgi:hypothetical protein